MAASMGTYGQFGIDTNATVANRVDYQDETFISEDELLDLNGLRGARGRDQSRVVTNLTRVHGPANFFPSASEWGVFLPFITGDTGTGSNPTTYNLKEALISYYVTIDRVAKVTNYVGVVPDKITISSRKGEAVKLSLDMVGISGTVNSAGSFPSLSINTTTRYFTHFNAVCTVNGVTVTPEEWTITIDNMIDRDRYFNSQTLVSVVPQDRKVSLSVMIPYGDFPTLNGVGNVISVFTATRGNSVLTITANNSYFPRKDPGNPGRKEIMLPLEGSCFTNIATPTQELIFSLNPTP